MAGVRGTVIVEIAVDESGKVSRVVVLRSIPLLDQAAIRQRGQVGVPARADRRRAWAGDFDRDGHLRARALNIANNLR